MYQYEFFDKRAYESYCKKTQVKRRIVDELVPDDFLRIDDIESVHSSYWAEHCLECGEPLCYEECSRFMPRADERCRLFEFGIRDAEEFPEFLFHSEIAFRPWGKLESIFYPGSYPPDQARNHEDIWRKRCAKQLRVTNLGRVGLLLRPIQQRRDFDNDKYGYAEWAGEKDGEETDTFLLQLYSYEPRPFRLFYEITANNIAFHRKDLVVNPGFNQFCFGVQEELRHAGKLRTHIYPENNLPGHIVILFCEYIRLTQDAQRRALQQDERPLASVPSSHVKCVAWDLDNTIWDGTLIESDPNSLQLRDEAFDMMQQLDKRGIIQVVASKNNSAEAMAVLDRLNISDMFVGFRINWGAKSKNLDSLARDLNIGLDTFALIDDSPFERGEVAETLPMVRVFPQNDLLALLQNEEFDVPVTADGKNRRFMYQAEARRKEARHEQAHGQIADDIESNRAFLLSCNLKATLKRPRTTNELNRALELLQRTNQLNLSGRRYSPEEFKATFQLSGAEHFILMCDDRFGSYGQVAYFRTHASDDEYVVDEFAMSCRTARKGVENALVLWLLEHAKTLGCATLVLRGKSTGRNGTLISSFSEIGFSYKADGNALELSIPTSSIIPNADIVEIRMAE